MRLAAPYRANDNSLPAPEEGGAWTRRLSAAACSIAPYIIGPSDTASGRSLARITHRDLAIAYEAVISRAIQAASGNAAPMQFDTKVAIFVLDDLATWQKLNVSHMVHSCLRASPCQVILGPTQGHAKSV
jgi:hypothetical protein